MHVRLICLAVLLWLGTDRSLVRTAQSAGAPRAVLIGVNKYGPEAGLKDLRYASSDAQNIARTLDSLGWNRENIQILITNELPASAQPTRQRIIDAIRSSVIATTATPNDTLLVVFAGHGFSQSGESFICPSDFDRSRPQETAVSINEIAILLEQSPAMAKAVVVDACRVGFTGEQLTEFDLLGSLRKGRGATSTKAPWAKGSTVFFSSCMPGEVSFEDAKEPIRGGVFMHFFGQALIGHADFDGGSHDGLVTASEAIAYASRRTRDHVRSRIDTMQTPWADCDSDSDISLATLSVDAKKRMMKLYGTERIEGLKGVKRQQAESMIDNAFGPLASGNRPLTIRFASAAIDMDAGYAIARRMRSLMYQLSGNDEPSRARHFYRLAIDDMRAVEGSLRVKLIKDQKIQADPRPDVAVSATDLVLIDDIITTDGIDWLHVNAYRRSNDDPLMPSQPVDGYLRLTEIADPESNAAQLAEFYRSLNQPNPRWAIRIAALLGSLAALPNAKRPEPAQKPEAASPIGTWDVIVDGKSKGTVTLKADGTFEDSSKHFYYYSNADWQKIVQKNEASYREAKQNVTQRLTHFFAKWEKNNNGSITLTRGHGIKEIFHDRNQFHHISEKYSWVFELTGQATEITALKCEERKNEPTVESNFLLAPKAAQSVTKETIMLRLKRSSP